VDRDAAFAQQLQQAELEQQNPSSKGAMEDRDAEIARQIYERDKAYADRQERDRKLAECLQAEEQTRDPFRDIPPAFYEHDVYEPTAEEYRRRPLHGATVAAVPECYIVDDENITASNARGRAEERVTVVGGVHRMKEEPVAFNGYDITGVLADEEPRAKTPPYEAGPPAQPDEDMIPCEWCSGLYPFEAISKHQVGAIVCTIVCGLWQKDTLIVGDSLQIEPPELPNQIIMCVKSLVFSASMPTSCSNQRSLQI
jgi:hypothetical protein